MSEAFLRIATGNILTRENYRIWLKEINLLASPNSVREYLHQEQIKTIHKSQITKEDLKNHIKVID